MSTRISFWKNFKKEYWKKKPTLIPRRFADSLITLEEIFEANQKAAAYKFNGISPHVRFYANEFLAQSHFEKYFPNSIDHSIFDYAKRINRTLKGERFGLVCNRLEFYSNFKFFLIAKKFLSRFQDWDGLAVGGAQAVSFIGNYARTPFGAHKDSADVFSFIIRGKKAFRFWKAKDLSPTTLKDPMHYVSRNKKSIFLEGNVGDIIYWPADYWHVGEGENELTASVSISLGVNEISSSFESQLKANVTSNISANFTKVISALEADNSYQFAKYKEKIAGETSARVLELMATEWLTLKTGAGLQVPPLPPESLSVSRSQWVCLKMGAELIMRELAESGTLLVAGNGQVICVKNTPEVKRFISTLQSFKKIRTNLVPFNNHGEVASVLIFLAKFQVIDFR